MHFFPISWSCIALPLVASQVPWSGVVACRAHSGWFPAAVFNLEDRCQLAGSLAFDAVHFMLRHIRNAIGEPARVQTYVV